MKRLNIIQAGLAIIFLIIALIVLGDLIGMFRANDFLGRYWPAILVLIGIITLNPDHGRGNVFSFGIFALGSLMLLHTLGLFGTSTGKLVLIILLALSGLMILLFTVGNSKTKNKSEDKDKELYF